MLSHYDMHRMRLGNLRLDGGANQHIKSYDQGSHYAICQQEFSFM